MDYGILVIVGILLVVLLLIRKAGTILKIMLMLILAAILLVSYILIFPTSPISKTCTSWVAQNLVLDPNNDYSNGEQIFEYDTQNLAEGAVGGMDQLAQALTNNPEIGSFFSDRLTAYITSQVSASDESKSSYLAFKDAYLQIDCSESFMKIIIVKGKQLQQPAA